MSLRAALSPSHVEDEAFCFTKNNNSKNIYMKRHLILPHVTKPGRYIGGEHNSIRKSWDDCTVRCGLIFPDLYEIGMSHQGLQILYHIVNQKQYALAERGYCPDFDMVKQLKQNNLPLTSLESGHSLAEFDIIGITLPYELCYSNILTILDLAGIDFFSRDRHESSPLIIGGGSCAMNPEPVADFFDAILLGDGEEAFLEIIETVKKAKETKCSRQELLHHLSRIDGLYIPSFFGVDYDRNGKIEAINPLIDGYHYVQRRVLPDLNRKDHLVHPIVPNAEIVHDRLGLEIARGCTRGCRFCQAGMIYRPVRERTVEQLTDMAISGIESSGFDELALLSLSTGDYSCLDSLMCQLMDHFSNKYVSISMPSMRVGTLTQSVMDQIRRVRKTGFTVAPEAGSERLRQVINKGISEEDLLTTCQDAFSLGWKLIKLYFMIGLPTETMEDIDSIFTLVKKAQNAGKQAGSKHKQINVSVGTFVPKPHTPFQWEPQLTINESNQRIQRLKQLLPRKGFKLKWHDPKQSYLEGVFSRGDRRLANLLVDAWKNGAGLDGWSDHFNLAVWQESAERCDINLDNYLRKRDTSEVLPWTHLRSGINDDFLKEELLKAHQLIYTPDCRYNNCQKCGLCDFKKIKPVVVNKIPTESQEIPGNKKDSAKKTSVIAENKEGTHYKYNVDYKKTGKICYLGHLEIIRLFFRALQRAKITVNFSQGYNPSPKISFSPPLPVGTESLAEFFIMDLPQPLINTKQTLDSINKELPEGMTVKTIQLHSGKFPQDVKNSYTIILPTRIAAQDLKRIDRFMSKDEVNIERFRKGKAKTINFRPLVEKLVALDENKLELSLINRAGFPSVKVSETIMEILPERQNEAMEIRILKTGWEEIDNK